MLRKITVLVLSFSAFLPVVRAAEAYLESDGTQLLPVDFRPTGGCAAADAERHLLVIDAKMHTLLNYAADGTLIKKATASQTTGYQVGASDRALVFFGNNGAVKADYEGAVPAKMRLYATKVYVGDVLTHDYVPAVKNGVAGLFDRESPRGRTRGLVVCRVRRAGAAGKRLC